MNDRRGELLRIVVRLDHRAIGCDAARRKEVLRQPLSRRIGEHSAATGEMIGQCAGNEDVLLDRKGDHSGEQAEDVAFAGEDPGGLNPVRDGQRVEHSRRLGDRTAATAARAVAFTKIDRPGRSCAVGTGGPVYQRNQLGRGETREMHVDRALRGAAPRREAVDGDELIEVGARILEAGRPERRGFFGLFFSAEMDRPRHPVVADPIRKPGRRNPATDAFLQFAALQVISRRPQDFAFKLRPLAAPRRSGIVQVDELFRGNAADGAIVIGDFQTIGIVLSNEDEHLVRSERGGGAGKRERRGERREARTGECGAADHRTL
jgi:hypothetical protein